MAVKKILSLIFLVLSLSSCEAETSIDDLMGRTKTTIYYWDEEKKNKKELITYAEDGSSIKQGKYMRWFQDGQIETELNYKDNKLQGHAIKYYANGSIEFEGQYKNGKKDGKWLDYYEHGQIENESEYKQGVKEGEFVGYYDNGQKDFQGYYEKGKKNRRWTEWYSDGSLSYDAYLIDGEKEGFGIDILLETVYIGEYKNGKQHGYGLSFDNEGIIWHQGEFKLGEMYEGVSFERWNNHYSDGKEETFYYKQIFESGRMQDKIEISSEEFIRIDNEKLIANFKDGLVGIKVGETNSQKINNFLGKIVESNWKELSSKGTNENVETSSGEQLFQVSCISCHGEDLSGRAPSLKNVGNRYSKDELSAIIKFGRGGMPSFDNINKDEIGKLAEWLYQQRDTADKSTNIKYVYVDENFLSNAKKGYLQPIEVGLGMTRNEATDLLGEPLSIMNEGGFEVLEYNTFVLSIDNENRTVKKIDMWYETEAGIAESVVIDYLGPPEKSELSYAVYDLGKSIIYFHYFEGEEKYISRIEFIQKD